MTSLQGKGTFPKYQRSLSPGEVMAIRIQCWEQGWRIKDILKRYPISRKTVSRLLNRQTYKDIP